MPEIIETRLTKRIYHDAESGFAIYRSCDSFSVKGNIIHDADALMDVLIRFNGQFSNGKYGREFSFDNYEILENEIYFFLTKIAKGIPSGVAMKIAQHFKDGGFEEALENDPTIFLSFKGIGKKKLIKLKEAWKSSRVIALIAKKLSPYGVTPNMVMRIHNAFGERAPQIIDENPYRLSEIRGVGFKKADDVARKLGIEFNDPKRIEACIVYLLGEKIAGDGHVYTCKEDLFKMLLDETTTENGRMIQSSAWELALSNLISYERITLFNEHLIALTTLYKKEREIISMLDNAQKYETSPLCDDIELFLNNYEARNNIILGDKQREAIRLTNTGVRCICISGYAGTGKTSSAKGSLELYAQMGVAPDDIVCCAFSGVAAARIKKQSGFYGSTIHSLLGYNPDKKGFQYDKKEKLPYRVVLLDEASMVDISILHSLISAIDFGRTTLIMLGDHAQLPPVGPGEPFSDVLAFELAPNVTLDKIYRQSEDAVITQFAQVVRSGQVPQTNGYYSDFSFRDYTIPNYWSLKKTLSQKDMQAINTKNQEEIAAQIVELASLCRSDIARFYKQDVWTALTFFQVIAPMKVGVLGVENLNQLLQPFLNPFSIEDPYITLSSGKKFCKGDKVIHLQNKNMNTIPPEAYKSAMSQNEELEFQDKKVYNGQIGILFSANKDEDEYYVYYPNEEYIAQYAKSDFTSGVLAHGFALTIHKSQGSEFRRVVLPIVNAHYIMLNNKLLYTAMTRAKEHLSILGEFFAFKTGCQKSGETARRTVIKALCQKAS